MIPGEDAARWLSRLVQIPSVTPTQAGDRPGSANEARIAAQIAAWFRDLGGEVHTETVAPERPSVYGIWRGTSERWFGVDVHTDTVGVSQMSGDPFSGRIADGRVYGRGSVDTKATLGVVLALLEHMQTHDLTPAANLLIAATADEEIEVQGAPAFAQWLRDRNLILDQLAVAEPTLCTPVHGHKGVCRVELTTHGTAAHSSQPHLGQNAIVGMTDVIRALAAEHERLFNVPPTTDLGTATLTVSLIRGGIGINTVPNQCTIALDRRVIPGEDPVHLSEQLHHIASGATVLPVTLRRLLAINAFFQAPDTPWLKQMAAWSGREPMVVPYGTNAFAYDDIARECVVIGPGSIDQAHSADEWVALAELEQLAAIYAHWWGITS